MTVVNLCALVVVVGSISFLCVAVDGACFFFLVAAGRVLHSAFERGPYSVGAVKTRNS